VEGFGGGGCVEVIFAEMVLSEKDAEALTYLTGKRGGVGGGVVVGGGGEIYWF
jgi:hypothetical protein